MLYFILMILGNALATENLSLSMVPYGKIFETRGRTYILKSKAGSKIQIRYHLDGSFKDASGIDLGHGDELEPGEGLLSLSTVAQIMAKHNEQPRGFWILEKDQVHGWIYDIHGTLICAKDGTLISKTNKTNK